MNNRVEQSHLPTRLRELRMQGLGHRIGSAFPLALQPRDAARKMKIEDMIRDNLAERGTQVVVRLIEAPNPFEGAERLVDAYGFGPLVPNTLLLGDSKEAASRERYAAMVTHFYKERRNVLIVRDRPERMTTDKLGSYAAAKQRIPELEGVEHEQVRASMRCNNRVEQAHQPTRIRERRMGPFRCPISAQRFLSAFARVCHRFRPRRHLLSASEYRSILRERLSTWREVTAFVGA